MSGIEKQCVLCGQSCAGQPRIKNGQGQYAHQACVKAKQSKAAPAASAPAASSAGAAADDDLALGLDDGLGDGLGDGLNAAFLLGAVPDESNDVSEGLRQGCPGCGNVLAGDAVVCTSCGFDTRSGKAMKTKIQKPEKEKRGSLTERSAAAAGASHLIGATIGAAVGSAIGAGIWAAVIVSVQFQASMIAIAVGALTGIGAAFGARGNVSVITGAIAVVFAIGGVVGGKWFGGSTLGDQVLDREIALFQDEWRNMPDEERAWYVQDDYARDILIARLERGNDGGVADFNYQMALRSDNYPESFPPDVVEETDIWWWSMDEQAQADYIDRFEDKRRDEFESARGLVHEAGFISTIGVRDFVYIGFAIILAAGLGSNENTAPFVKS